jgi:transcriptional regulator with XRE-family HTH domain
MTIGTKIRLKRTHFGYSQQYFASMLNVSENTYRKIEGDIAKPKLAQLEKIAEKLGMKVEDLINQEGGVTFYDEVKCESGGYIGLNNGIVHTHRPIGEIEEENKRLVGENTAKDLRINDLSKTIENLEEIIKLLKKDNR